MTGYIITFIGGVAIGALFGAFIMAIVASARNLGDEPDGYVDQDHHGHCSINDFDGENTPSRHQWKGNSVHRP